MMLINKLFPWMNIGVAKSLALGLCLASSACYSYAYSDSQDIVEKEVKVWIDSPVHFPASPISENLLAFYSNESQRFFIDRLSVSVAADGSFRYTIVSISSTGAKNVSYEGLRCDSNEKRLFAFGRHDGSWSASRRDNWDGFSARGINQQHATLAWDFVCEGGSVAGNADKIIQRIQQKQSLRQFH
ncbi:CNP1-like family protein [Undibacterium fentianense]|uniref:CNP1-like family protein n=1 Tax=Undibacterium fentianense TaxID=2828728 RepID=A0A941DXY6_9BURK|nr:CNP1-like family protein [Undibacterium fentianense]MBR7799494.1 CNP1-like family protein [Undibacterium fentianense]